MPYVNPVVRFVAALMLAFMVPVQAGAAACAQVCAHALLQSHGESAVGEEHADHSYASTSDGPGDDLMHGHHCDKSDPAGKCCQGHTVMTQRSAPPSMVSIPAFERSFFVERWTSFVPEEPSPPPILSSRAA